MSLASYIWLIPARAGEAVRLSNCCKQLFIFSKQVWLSQVPVFTSAILMLSRWRATREWRTRAKGASWAFCILRFKAPYQNDWHANIPLCHQALVTIFSWGLICYTVDQMSLIWHFPSLPRVSLQGLFMYMICGGLELQPLVNQKKIHHQLFWGIISYTNNKHLLDSAEMYT